MKIPIRVAEGGMNYFYGGEVVLTDEGKDSDGHQWGDRVFLEWFAYQGGAVRLELDYDELEALRDGAIALLANARPPR